MPTKESVYKNTSQKVYSLSDDQRENYRRLSKEAREAKQAAEKGLLKEIHQINTPELDPNELMPQLAKNNLRCLSLFSGGGGLDLGFDRAGFTHIASYELIPICKETLTSNRPNWCVYAGLEEGDVTKVNWEDYKGKVDVIHGGPPCQPFSVAGEQKGHDDTRNMWGDFIKAVNTIKPRAFVAENVLGLLNPKFKDFVDIHIIQKLKNYHIVKFEMNAADFGVPQTRRRVIFVGFQKNNDLKKFKIPSATHSWSKFKKTKTMQTSIFSQENSSTMGVREALGLPDIGVDNLSPTIRSAFTGKRNTTSILNSAAGQKYWAEMEIWPNGVQKDRSKASSFPAKNGHFRLSVQDVAIIQGFPHDWKFAGAVYQILGQIGNSVAPPVAYNVASNLAQALIS